MAFISFRDECCWGSGIPNKRNIARNLIKTLETEDVWMIGSMFSQVCQDGLSVCLKRSKPPIHEAEKQEKIQALEPSLRPWLKLEARGYAVSFKIFSRKK